MLFTSYSGFCADLSSRGPAYAAAHARALGYSSVEMLASYTAKRTLSELYPAAEMKKVLSAEGLTVACVSVYAHLLEMGEEKLRHDFADHIAYAAALGSPFLHHTLLPGRREADSPSYEEVLPRILDLAEWIAVRAAEAGITCLYEPQGLYFNGEEGLGRFFSEMSRRCPGVGICADFGNSLFADWDPVAFLRVYGGEVRHVHIKDYRVSDTPLPGAMRSLSGRYLTDALPGEGDIDLATCLRLVGEGGYRGPVSLEFSADDAATRRAMAYCEELANQCKGER